MVHLYIGSLLRLHLIGPGMPVGHSFNSFNICSIQEKKVIGYPRPGATVMRALKNNM
jgi:hypothetical protein